MTNPKLSEKVQEERTKLDNKHKAAKEAVSKAWTELQNAIDFDTRAHEDAHRKDVFVISVEDYRLRESITIATTHLSESFLAQNKVEDEFREYYRLT